MALKIYGMHGYTTASVRVPAGDGRAWIMVEFSKGRPTPGANYSPAKYATRDKTIQSIIENSNMFNRSIKLVAVYPETEDRKVESTATEAPTPKAENRNYPDVETYEQAIAALKALGAKATQLRSITSIKNVMANYGVTFPNCKELA